MADDRVMWVAQRAAELLPEAPAAHDPFGYLAWEELVLDTARRLETLVDAGALHGVAHPRLSAEAGRLDASSLLTLAALLARDLEPASCEAMLHHAVDAGLHNSGSAVAVLTRHR